ncbi:Jacalin-related lectin 18 [Cardamine amara subsp. amara]|uniref:Jacalin-related lectin 18 n=1 Tax=Cardamine amara subsp. amara TaxID=228776 RepID=A0ABD1B0A7_CARAN
MEPWSVAIGDENFLLEEKGYALVGFYGWTYPNGLSALGAYYRLLPPPPDANKIEAMGGDGGDSWDYGSFEGDHGNKTFFGIQEFELDYPTEYVTSVEGSYDRYTGVITMLRFKTNKQTTPHFGRHTTSSSSFLLHRDDHMIVGFHGRSSSNMLHQIGVHVIPI